MRRAARRVRASVEAACPSASRFVPQTKCDSMASASGARHLQVPEFFLMTQPATNLCYSECVKRGGCTAPAHDIADPNPRAWNDDHRAIEPVYVDHSQAEFFCAWLGGRLPSIAELVRAAQGDDNTVPGVAAMTAAAIDCAKHPNPSSQICGQLKQMDLFYGPPPLLYPVGVVARDVGPFGHQDLFGSVVEWTATAFDEKAFCALADGAPDFVTFPQPNPAHPQHVGLEFASTIENAIRDPAQEHVGIATADDATVAYYLGFRCAFTNLALPP